MKQFLEILWIDYGLSKEEIKKAYHKKSMQVHPDRANGDEYKMMLLNTAYEYIIENYESYLNKQEIIEDNPLALFNEWLYIYYVLKDYELALNKFTKVIELDSSNDYAYYLQWLCLKKLWKQTEALKALKYFQNKNPRYLPVYYVIIDILEKKWDLEEVTEYKHLLQAYTPEKKINLSDLFIKPNENYQENIKTDNSSWKSKSNINFILFVLCIIISYFIFPELWEYLINVGKKLRTFTDSIFFNK